MMFDKLLCHVNYEILKQYGNSTFISDVNVERKIYVDSDMCE